MLAYVSGDEAAFRVLFGRAAPRLQGFFARSLGPDASTELLQTTFLKVHKARFSYDSSYRVMAWIFGIAARVRLDELRRRYRLPARATEEDVAELVSSDDVQHEMENDNLAQQVRDAVQSLPEGQRVIVHLHRFEGLTFREIAQALDLEEGAVRVRAFRAYDTLRKRLANLREEAMS